VKNTARIVPATSVYKNRIFSFMSVFFSGRRRKAEEPLKQAKEGALRTY
jgi:hypothetical protein